jgi:hypothetical protein
MLAGNGEGYLVYGEVRVGVDKVRILGSEMVIGAPDMCG